VSLHAVREVLSGPAVDKLAGVGLILATAAALAWANSPLAASYEALREATFGLPFDPALSNTAKRWTNDGLMTLFFLLVGLEIKREVVEGELADLRQASLTLAGAAGGMAVPVAIFVALNQGGVGLRGWAIPMATDIAFAVGLLALAGGRAAAPVRLFLIALAVIDDLGAVLVIALFYGHDPKLAWLAGAAAVFLAALAYGWWRRAHPLAVLILGLALWYCMLKSGVHPTIAGVLLALTIPLRSHPPDEPDSEDFEHRLKPWVLLLVMPVFALLNAGVTFDADLVLLSPITLGIALGLFLGKPIGIVGACWLCVRTGLGKLPAGVGWPALASVGLLAGLGFTMSLFIAQLSFDEGTELAQSKAAILATSALAGVLGLAMLRLVTVRQR
jgi:NhaA family Na+:H+ antiporter